MTETIAWISVDDELPDADTDVLICFIRNDCDETLVTEATYDDSHEDDGPWTVDGGLMCFGTVTHWAEMPKGPTQ